jgi:hypothetical protein
LQRRIIISHIVVIKTEVRDAAAISAACQRLGLPPPVEGKVKLFSGESEGLAVQLPGWTYPIVCDTTAAHVKFDNFDGRWGDQHHLDSFLQMYAVCRATAEARRRGHSVSETAQADGAIKLVIQVAGGIV